MENIERLRKEVPAQALDELRRIVNPPLQGKPVHAIIMDDIVSHNAENTPERRKKTLAWYEKMRKEGHFK